MHAQAEQKTPRAAASGLERQLVALLGQAMEILRVPAGNGWTMGCMVSFGYPTGRRGVAPRRPVHEVSSRNSWGTAVGFAISEPLWSP